MDTLKGNLELFGLDAVAGLLASARKTGALRVAVDGLNGRLFFVEGSLVYATTRKHDGSVNDLRGRGTEVRDRRHTWSLSLPELLRHQITDVVVRILRRNGGEFMFDEGVTTTALPSGRTLSFSAPEMIQRARERLDEWREIEEAIPDSTVRYRLASDLPPDLFELTVDARMWTFLAAIGDGASASDLAERLRIFEFPAAKKMAEFVRNGLLVPVDAAAADRALRLAREARSLAAAVDESRPADHQADGSDTTDEQPVVVTMVAPDPQVDAVPHGIAVTEAVEPVAHEAPEHAAIVDDAPQHDPGPVVETSAPVDEYPESDDASMIPVVAAESSIGSRPLAALEPEWPEAWADHEPAGPSAAVADRTDSFDAETASHALAEWGEVTSRDTADFDTRSTSEVIADVDGTARHSNPEPVVQDDGSDADTAPAAHPPSSFDAPAPSTSPAAEMPPADPAVDPVARWTSRFPQRPPLPEVPAPPPWVPVSTDDDASD